MSYLVLNPSVSSSLLPRITLFGKGALMRCYRSLEVQKVHHEDNCGEYYTWHASTSDVLRHAYDKEQIRWGKDDNSRVLFDMDPGSESRIWIARLDDVYAVTYTKSNRKNCAVNSKEWTVMMLRMTDQIVRVNLKGQPISKVKNNALRQLQRREVEDGASFHEFLYVTEQSNGSWGSKPGVKNVTALYKSAMSYFLQHIKI